MYTEPTTFRPRNGLSAESYWRIRAWCRKNGFNFSDVLNALIIPIAYYLENFTKIDKLRSKATVDLNVGPVDILHVFNGKCYPLAPEISDGTKDSFTEDNIQQRIDHWKERNAKNPQHIDLLLLKPDAKNKATKRK